MSQLFHSVPPVFASYHCKFDDAKWRICKQANFWKGLLPVPQSITLMMLNFMCWDCCVSGKQCKYTAVMDFARLEMPRQSGDTSKCSSQFCLEFKETVCFSQQPHCCFFLLFYLHHSIPHQFFNIVIHLLDLLTLLQHFALQLMCPSRCGCCKRAEQTNRKMSSQRAVCLQECWLCKDWGPNLSGGTIVYGL